MYAWKEIQCSLVAHVFNELKVLMSLSPSSSPSFFYWFSKSSAELCWFSPSPLVVFSGLGDRSREQCKKNQGKEMESDQPCSYY